MSSWNGADGEFVAEGMPHKTKVARKPERVGAEMKSLACGDRYSLETGYNGRKGSKSKKRLCPTVW